MNNDELFGLVKEKLSLHKVGALRELLKGLHAADIAGIMEELPSEERAVFFRFLNKDVAAEVFSYLTPPRQTELIKIFDNSETAELISRLYVDDAVDVLEELPANLVSEILKITEKTKRDQLNRFLKYKEDSAGSVMSAEFIKLGPDISVKEAIDRIRKNKSLLASYSLIYVTSKSLKLLGAMSIRELLVADDSDTLKDIMHAPAISVKTDTDQEEALKIIKKYDFQALPVTDSEGRLVGVITSDDALDISEEEATDDFSIMAAMSPNDYSYFDTSIFEHAKSRLPWLIFLILSGMLNGVILGTFESAFVVMPILVTFIPMLTDTGGNTGSQSSTLIIRGLAVGEIRKKDFLRVLFKELRVSFLVGFILAIVSFLRVWVFPPYSMIIGIVVGLAVWVIVIFSKLIGGMLPLLAERLGLDPALMAAPIVTTLIDAGGLLVFFSLAKVILGI